MFLHRPINEAKLKRGIGSYATNEYYEGETSKRNKCEKESKNNILKHNLRCSIEGNDNGLDISARRFIY